MKELTVAKERAVTALQANAAKAEAQVRERLVRLRENVLADLAAYEKASLEGRTKLGEDLGVVRRALELAQATDGPITYTVPEYEALIEGKLFDECDCLICTAMKDGRGIAIPASMLPARVVEALGSLLGGLLNKDPDAKADTAEEPANDTDKLTEKAPA